MRIVLILTFLLVGSYGYAQSVFFPNEGDTEYANILFNEERTFEFRMHSNGISLGYNKGNILKYYLTRFYHFDIGYLRHPKEFRQNLRSQAVLQSLTSTSGYIYGKQNSLLTLRGGIGEIRYFGEKAKRKGVAVGVSYQGGPSLGIVKPYYLDLKRFDEENGVGIVTSSERYGQDDNEELFLDPNSIYSYTGFFKGLGEIKIIAGIQARGAVHFSWGANDKYVKVLETGIMIDFYARKIPLLIIEQNRSLFINLYLSLQFGKRK